MYTPWVVASCCALFGWQSEMHSHPPIANWTDWHETKATWTGPLTVQLHQKTFNNVFYLLLLYTLTHMYLINYATEMLRQIKSYFFIWIKFKIFVKIIFLFVKLSDFPFFFFYLYQASVTNRQVWYASSLSSSARSLIQLNFTI